MSSCERDQISIDVVIDRMKTDSLLRSLFRKEPRKQNILEVCQMKWIKANLYPDVVKLPQYTGGTYFCDGKKVKCVQETRPPNATKTMDLHVPSENIYMFLKYTDGSGGAQDNQFKDVVQTLKEIGKYYDANPTSIDTFVIYADGTYYTDKKLQYLKDMIPMNLTDKIKVDQVSNIKAREKGQDGKPTQTESACGHTPLIHDIVEGISSIALSDAAPVCR